MKHYFKVRYNPQIYLDIQKTVDYYRRETGDDKLGIRFVKAINNALKKLRSTALLYQVRYDDIRFLPIHPFSIVAHFRVDKQKAIVIIEAIFHSSEDPDEWNSVKNK
ncbi:MAG: type II toxin-antitoxin system RelE/ParE family toxin [Chitinophagales bacterium]